MKENRGRLLGLTGGAAVLLGLVVLALTSCSSPPAPRPTAAMPSAPGTGGYVGAEACKQCHEDQFNRFGHTKMGRLFLKHPRNQQEAAACENCHGPGKDPKIITFAKNDPTPIERRNQTCLTCHTKGARLFWEGSAHESRDVACTSCHTVMDDVSPKSQLAKTTVIDTCGSCHQDKRARQARFSHMPLWPGRAYGEQDTKMTCTSCHNPHGTVTPALLKENSVNDTCYTCHAEKRGPFLWEHAPVPESCSNCHDPHGSNHERMLKLAKPRLCQQCHNETRHPTSPYGRDTGSLKFVMGRSCASCHVNIHGSNHPSGFAFTR
jgi:DmsE family decaheme c-type cytochrome